MYNIKGLKNVKELSDEVTLMIWWLLRRAGFKFKLERRR